jgi:hypothetical protein
MRRRLISLISLFAHFFSETVDPQPQSSLRAKSFIPCFMPVYPGAPNRPMHKSERLVYRRGWYFCVPQRPKCQLRLSTPARETRQCPLFLADSVMGSRDTGRLGRTNHPVGFEFLLIGTAIFLFSYLDLCAASSPSSVSPGCGYRPRT